MLAKPGNIFATFLFCSAFGLAAGAAAQEAAVADAFTAATANMTPAGLPLEIEILEWSNPENRAAVASALQSDSGIGEKLRALPTRGYVWVDGSSVGYSIKYAHRTAGEQRGERVTIVIDRALGSYNYEPWTAGERIVSEGIEYSVISLDLESGVGHFTPIADAGIDAANALVTLRPDDSAEPPLTDVARRPKPYWTGND